MSLRRVVAACLALLLVLLASAAAVWALLVNSPEPSTPAGQQPGCRDVVSAQKPPLKGLLTIAQPPPPTSTTPLAGWSVNVPWSALQPDGPGAIAHPNPLDEALAELDRRSPQGCRLGLKVRVLAGVSAPEWAKQLGGEPVPMAITIAGSGAGDVPRFWSAEFGQAYADLHRLLAQEYDRVLGVREVVMSRCTTFYAEPMLRQLNEGGNQEALSAAGWNQAVDVRCFAEQTAAHQVWRLTPSSLALNPYRSGGAQQRGYEGDVSVPIAAAQECRTTLEQRCILANNSVRFPPLPGYAELYSRLRELGGPFEFQAAAPARIGDPAQALAWAVEFGAGSVELSPRLVDAAGVADEARELAGTS